MPDLKTLREIETRYGELRKAELRCPICKTPFGQANSGPLCLRCEGNEIVNLPKVMPRGHG